MRSKPRPAQEGQLYFIFLSPDQKVTFLLLNCLTSLTHFSFQVFHSRKAVIQHMEKLGNYTEADFSRVKKLARPGPKPNAELKAKLKSKLKMLNGVKRRPGRPSKADMEMRERELMRIHREERMARESIEVDSNTSNSGYRINYKEESDSWGSDDDEGGFNIRTKRRKKKLQRKKRKTA